MTSSNTASTFRSKLNSLKNTLSTPSHWLCFFSGFFLVFAYAPFSIWWLPLVLPSVVLYQIRSAAPKLATKKLGLFALGWFTSGISWVHVSIEQFGGMPLVFSLLLMLALCLYLSLFPALAGYLTAKISKTKQLNLWLLPSIWLFCEYLRSVVLTGFPWLSLGYSQIDSPLASFAPVIGEVGITAIVLLINICLVKLYLVIFSKINLNNNAADVHISDSGIANSSTSNNVAKHRLISVSAPLAILIGITITSGILSQQHWTTLTGESTKVALIQGNITQSLKWQPDEEWPIMEKYLALTQLNSDADLIIWPESAITALEPTIQDYLSNVNQLALLNNSAIITGLLNYSYQENAYYNAMLVLGKKNTEDKQGYYYNHSNRYYKNHLLPIGEFVPFQELLRPIAPFFNLPQSSFSAGDYVQPNLIAKNIPILPLNCFEIAFPSQLAANLTKETQMILTVSNDAWFGDSHGPHQHFEIARMRALEFGRPVLRATNNGVTGIIDQQGNVTAIAPQFEEYVLRGKVDFVSGFTPYSQWPNAILWLMIILPIILIKALGFKA
ncbi:apolipoprotein N-acyltransferase [Colwellia echini]|uniref:Apolipoprotein N-acyltransferase n=1 Tax=Colwellia echini TaxID=1982103 RepID=A0ABY3MTA7_9GAMM|nr:apolipoprotein N-acyltransferase [Colwellia echini]TYK64327.1 apolipoprotein N-acyltransferase [Colwellia echini]